MMSDLLIRECTMEDLPTIKSLGEQTFIESFGEDNKKEDLNEYLLENFSPDKLEKVLQNVHSRFYLAFLSGEPAAYMKVNFEGAHTEKGYGNALEVQRIYVPRKYLGQKIGKKLMEKAMEIGRESDLDYLWLGVWEKNISAIGFYQSMGFEKIGEHIFVIGEDRQLDYLMKLEL